MNTSIKESDSKPTGTNASIEYSQADFGDLRNPPLRLQIVDKSSPSKPDNYRISPITPQSITMTASSVLHDASLTEDATPIDIQTVLENWSGRGTHVDFLPNETVPLKEGRFLGHGSMGGVFETTIRGHAFAWKRRFCRRRIGEAEMKEIEILKKVSHRHIVKIAGSYTHRQFLGLLLHPVAVCDLATLLEDQEAVIANTFDIPQMERLVTLGMLKENGPTYMRCYPLLLSKMGCIVRAVEYLHSQKIRHKDLKPSNILLSSDGLWLTDFGTATDFSLQTTSTTENGERGTPKYFAPEVAAFKPSGRAADIFSLGCILLEIYIICQDQTLEILRKLRNHRDKSFQANLEQIQAWLRKPTSSLKTADLLLQHNIHAMINEDPASRPTIDEVRSNLALLDTFQMRAAGHALFDDCCREVYISQEEHEGKMAQKERKIEELGKLLTNQQDILQRHVRELDHNHQEILALREKIITMTNFIENNYVHQREHGALPPSTDEVTQEINLDHPFSNYTSFRPLENTNVDQSEYGTCPMCGSSWPLTDKATQHMNLEQPWSSYTLRQSLENNGVHQSEYSTCPICGSLWPFTDEVT